MSKIARFNSIVNAAIATLILASCSDVYEGIVFEKRHEPLSVSTVMQTVAIINGQSVTVMLVPTQVIDDEDWVITIEGYSRKKAAVRRRDVYVSPGEYEAVNVGDWFLLRPSDHETADTDVKRRIREGRDR